MSSAGFRLRSNCLKMGGCISSEEYEAKTKSKKITQEMKRDHAKNEDCIKLLLLGAGESGKSTIVKQMKIIHTNGYSQEDCMGFRHVIHLNLFDSMRAIVGAMDILGIDFGDLKLEVQSKSKLTDMALAPGELLERNVLELIEDLWHDKGIQECYQRSREYHLSDGACYLLDHIGNYKDEDFVPTEQDILHVRVETKGIIEVKFTHKETDFVLFDVGGQRNQRRKWIHCFSKVTAIIFCASLSAYDMVLAEDGTTNRMEESLDIFRSIVNSEIFTNTSMLLFLNKTDLLKKKICTSPLTICFPDYKGTRDYAQAAAFIELQFLSKNLTRDSDRIYVHHTCATDTNTIKNVFKVAAQAIMRENLQRCGLI